MSLMRWSISLWDFSGFLFSESVSHVCQVFFFWGGGCLHVY